MIRGRLSSPLLSGGLDLSESLLIPLNLVRRMTTRVVRLLKNYIFILKISLSIIYFYFILFLSLKIKIFNFFFLEKGKYITHK